MQQEQIQDEIREKIARRAFEIYLEGGCQTGRELEDWLQAEGEFQLEEILQSIAAEK